MTCCESLRQPFVLFRLFPSQLVIEVRHARKGEADPSGQSRQNFQQAHRIGPA